MKEGGGAGSCTDAQEYWEEQLYPIPTLSFSLIVRGQNNFENPQSQCLAGLVSLEVSNCTYQGVFVSKTVHRDDFNSYAASVSQWAAATFTNWWDAVWKLSSSIVFLYPTH